MTLDLDEKLVVDFWEMVALDHLVDASISF